MMPRMHSRYRELLPVLKPSQKDVLMALCTRANDRLRCWPSTERLIADTGLHLNSVIEARKYLIETGAIKLVLGKDRVGDEKKLPPRQFVYELTGVICLNGQMVPYLYVGAQQVAQPAQSFAKSEPLTMSNVHKNPEVYTYDNSGSETFGNAESFTIPPIELYPVKTQEEHPTNTIQKEKAAAESSTHVRAGAREAAAAAAAEPAPSAPASVDLGKDRAPVAEQGRGAPHPLLAAWIEAHVERGITATITKDLQRIAENYARMGLQADDVRGLTAHKLAGGRSEYSFRFIEADVTAWRNARFESQMQRPGGAPARRFDADAWEPEPAAPPAVPRPFDARWKATFEKAWLSLDAQAVREGNATADWRHLQKAQLMDADGARFVLAFETPVGVAVANKWGRNIERVLFDAGLGAVPREVRMEAITMDEWRKRLTQMQPAAAPAAAAV